jgi:hypothetical protein
LQYRLNVEAMPATPPALHNPQHTTITITDLREGQYPDVRLMDVTIDITIRGIILANTARHIIGEHIESTLTDEQITELFAHGNIRIGEYIVCHHSTNNRDNYPRAYSVATDTHRTFLQAIAAQPTQHSIGEYSAVQLQRRAELKHFLSAYANLVDNSKNTFEAMSKVLLSHMK